MSRINPVREIISRADRLGSAFADAHAHTVRAVLSLQQHYHQAAPNPLPENIVEMHLDPVRNGLLLMEGAVNEMISLVFQIDVFKNDTSADGHAPIIAAGFDPKEALGHVSDLFHMYQAELLAKRESLADFTCEDIDIDTFAAQWQRLDEVEQGKKQEVDDLAELLAGLG
ncbi:hypothetical protein OC846_004427 [Tilletia horrida]|uniref:Uncharacterized protein n=1 Tax=Tilletia horrida TaxID=155126 RepID=A0AAN6JR51_9BASI|nr:hypothetical protein OC845_005086 [Tilletia horrida]KAK0548597.1 hypothetical protein OC846_004427 [Tilletia horrida]KAK0566316.1 hypothetical protein OC861_003317 [Tilletia horrida]